MRKPDKQESSRKEKNCITVTTYQAITIAIIVLNVASNETPQPTSVIIVKEKLFVMPPEFPYAYKIKIFTDCLSGLKTLSVYFFLTQPSLGFGRK